MEDAVKFFMYLNRHLKFHNKNLNSFPIRCFPCEIQTHHVALRRSRRAVMYLWLLANDCSSIRAAFSDVFITDLNINF